MAKESKPVAIMQSRTAYHWTLLLAVGLLLLPTSIHGKNAPAGGVRRPISGQILGSWKIDRTKMLAELKAKNRGKALDEDAVREVDTMLRSLMLEFLPNGRTQSHHFDRTEKAKYEIVRIDPETREFLLKVSAPGDEADLAKARINGDSMVITMIAKAHLTLHFTRLRADEAKAHLKAIKKLVPGG